MRKFIFLTCLLLSADLLAAQNSIRFSKTYLPTMSSASSSIIPCNDGDIIYGLAYPSGYSCVSLIKIDSTGSLQWKKLYGKSGYNYNRFLNPLGGGGASVPWGGYIGAGYVSDSTNTWYKMMLYRFDTNGDTIWTRTYNDTANLEGLYVKIARKNRYIIGATWANYAIAGGGYTPVLIETDSLGNIIWQKTYPTNTTSPNPPGHFKMIAGIDTCRDGGFIISTQDYDTTSNCGGRIVIMKTDSLGNLMWTTFGYNLYYCNADAGGIISLKDGGYLICGAQDTKINSFPSYPSPILFMEKLTDNGTEVWSKTYGIAAMYEGSVYLIMPHELANGDIIACGNADTTGVGCILKTDSNGNQQWLRYYKMNSPTEQNYLLDIKQTSDGGYIATGFIESPTNTWVVKTDSLGCSDSTGCVYTGVQEYNKAADDFKLYPNPTNGSFTIASQTSVNDGEYVDIYNMLGQKIYQHKLNPSTTDINLSPAAKGIYLYRISSANGMLLSDGKFVIQ